MGEAHPGRNRDLTCLAGHLSNDPSVLQVKEGIPRRAWKASSARPSLAVKTALMTLRSMLGSFDKCSLRLGSRTHWAGRLWGRRWRAAHPDLESLPSWGPLRVLVASLVLLLRFPERRHQNRDPCQCEGTRLLKALWAQVRRQPVHRASRVPFRTLWMM